MIINAGEYLDYNEPPVLVGGPVPINGRWVNGRAMFDNFKSGILAPGTHAWVWALDGTPIQIAVRWDSHPFAVTPDTTLTIDTFTLEVPDCPHCAARVGHPADSPCPKNVAEPG